ncbi:MAG: enterochelin esterase domain-containing protein [Desertimonas sp.]
MSEPARTTRPPGRHEDPLGDRASRPGAAVAAVIAAAGAGEEGSVTRMLDELWARPRPIVEPDPDQPGWSIVTFLWRGRRTDRAERDDEVHVLVNRLTQRGDLAASRLEHVPGTDLWWRSWTMRDDWMASYQLAPRRRPTGLPIDVAASLAGTAAGPWRTPGSGDDQAVDDTVAHATIDPANPLTLASRWGGPPMSVVRLPAAPADDMWDRRGSPTPLVAESVRDPDGHPRSLWWRAPTNTGDGIDLLVMLDGQYWGPLYGLGDALDRLEGADLIDPTVAVFIDSVDDATRRHDYTANPRTADWLADDIVAWARRRWPIGDRRHVTIVGQSLGGLMALSAGDRRPDVIGSVLAQSPSLWWPGGSAFDQDAGAVIRQIAEHGDRGVHVDLAVGLQEPILLPWARHLRDVLVAGGHSMVATEYNGGHDFVWWRLAITAALRRRDRQREP